MDGKVQFEDLTKAVICRIIEGEAEGRFDKPIMGDELDRFVFLWWHLNGAYQEELSRNNAKGICIELQKHESNLAGIPVINPECRCKVEVVKKECTYLRNSPAEIHVEIDVSASRLEWLNILRQNRTSVDHAADIVKEQEEYLEQEKKRYEKRRLNAKHNLKIFNTWRKDNGLNLIDDTIYD